MYVTFADRFAPTSFGGTLASCKAARRFDDGTIRSGGFFLSSPSVPFGMTLPFDRSFEPYPPPGSQTPIQCAKELGVEFGEICPLSIPEEIALLARAGFSLFPSSSIYYAPLHTVREGGGFGVLQLKDLLNFFLRNLRHLSSQLVVRSSDDTRMLARGHCVPVSFYFKLICAAECWQSWRRCDEKCPPSRRCPLEHPPLCRLSKEFFSRSKPLPDCPKGLPRHTDTE